MSYDGGLVVKIANKQLLDILKKHDAKGAFEGAGAIVDMFGTKYKGKTLAVDYEYYDCAYVDGCPKNLSSVFNYVTELLDFYGDDADNRTAFKEFLTELKASKSLIDSDYTFVEWIYYGEDSTEKFTYENGTENYDSDCEEDSYDCDGYDDEGFDLIVDEYYEDDDFFD